MGGSDLQGGQPAGPRGSAGQSSGQDPAHAPTLKASSKAKRTTNTEKQQTEQQLPPADPSKQQLAHPPGSAAENSSGSQDLQVLAAGDDNDGNEADGGLSDTPANKTSGSRRRGRKSRGRRAGGTVGAPQEAEQDEANMDDSERALRNTRYEGQFFKTKLCAFWQKNQCTRGQMCKYAHGAPELQTMPDLTNTSLCRNMTTKGSCDIEGCPFAHSPEELRATDKFYKTTMCSYSISGRCWLGALCRHAHHESELRQVAQGSADPSVDQNKAEEDDLNEGMHFARATTQPVPRRDLRVQPMLEVKHFQRQTSQPDPVQSALKPRLVPDQEAKHFKRQTSQPDPVVGRPQQRLLSEQEPKTFKRQTSQPDPVQSQGQLSSRRQALERGSQGRGLVVDARSMHSSQPAEQGRQQRGVVLDARSSQAGRPGHPLGRPFLWSEDSDDDFDGSTISSPQGPGWSRASTLPATLPPPLPHAPQAKARLSTGRLSSGQNSRVPTLEDIDEDLAQPMPWGRSVTQPALSVADNRRREQEVGTMRTIAFEAPPVMMHRAPMPQSSMMGNQQGAMMGNQQGAMMGNQQGAMMGNLMGQVGAHGGCMAMPDAGAIQHACAGSGQGQAQWGGVAMVPTVVMQAVPVMMVPVPQVPQQQLAPNGQDAPMMEQPSPVHQFPAQMCVRMQQDGFMAADGPPSRQISAGVGTPVPQDIFLINDGCNPSRQVSSTSFGTGHGHIQDPFSASMDPPSRQISTGFCPMNQDPFSVSMDPPSRQISTGFCNMNQDETAKVLEDAMPEHYEE